MTEMCEKLVSCFLTVLMILLTAGSNYISLVRVQTVVAEGLKSSPQMVDKGVPQGAILGSLLFILYINIIEFILIQH